ncbi:MAG: MiaB/RimO family radical SAM methylthiotransferase [Anaerolineales bacterium]|nr:MiaB/RimO family radical SAM methylthiotransferase [Anaerolineales bacterium]
MKVFFDLVGCRVNEAEIESMSAETLALRHEIAPSAEIADWIVINTCTVTREAERDSRQKIRQAHNRNGAARIVATGCWATMEPVRAAGLPGVTRVVLNAEKEGLMRAILGGEAPTAVVPGASPIPARRRTRAYIKIQDGCDNACTYCVTRLARGNLHSRTMEAILADILAAQRSGAKEAVLAGVHLGAWGRDLGNGLVLEDLLEDILSRTAIPRLRLSSLEPWDLHPDFFRLWHDGRLCPHLHLPLQSGCGSTLRRMNRRTSPEEYADIVEAARAQIPDLAVTTDFMVGFPGEDESEFRESIGFVERMRFARLHIFHFSPRAGTAAAEMESQVAPEDMRHRAMWARHIGGQAADSFSRAFLGREMDVLWEADTRGGLRRGLTGNFLRVRVQSEDIRPNTLSRVKLLSIDRGELVGEVKS